jgi:hypothetical protein
VATQTRKRRPKPSPAPAVHPAGSPEAVQLVRGFIAQQQQIRERGLAEAELGLHLRHQAFPAHRTSPVRGAVGGGPSRLFWEAGRENERLVR